MYFYLRIFVSKRNKMKILYLFILRTSFSWLKLFSFLYYIFQHISNVRNMSLSSSSHHIRVTELCDRVLQFSPVLSILILPEFNLFACLFAYAIAFLAFPLNFVRPEIIRQLFFHTRSAWKILINNFTEDKRCLQILGASSTCKNKEFANQ
jgi:hypothetical protein